MCHEHAPQFLPGDALIVNDQRFHWIAGT